MKSDLNEQKSKCTQQLLEVDKELQELRAQKAISASKLAKAKSDYEALLKKQSINDISARALLAFDELQKTLYDESIRLVETGFSQFFASLINKSDLIDGIHIDDSLNVLPYKNKHFKAEDEQVDDFIKDVKGIYLHDTLENTIEHFFGGIVAVEKRIPGSNRQQRELIDGQQRITTTLLLIIALIRKYEKLKDVSNGTLIDNRINKLRQKYLRYDDEINREPITVQKLVLSKADKQYFEDLIETRECTERRDSHRRINRAFKKT